MGANEKNATPSRELGSSGKRLGGCDERIDEQTVQATERPRVAPHEP